MGIPARRHFVGQECPTYQTEASPRDTVNFAER